jgi:hypothetical protein
MENDMASDIDETLQERQKTYGDFRDVAASAVLIRDLLVSRPYRAIQEEALTMIANKLARIIQGDPDYPDSWRDIAGYAMLVVAELEEMRKSQ